MIPGASIARVCVDSPLPHLDRLFDYTIPDKLVGMVTVGSRVRVRFSGRLIGAVVCEVDDRTSFEGRLDVIRSASAAPSFTEEAIVLARSVAQRYGGSLSDVLRLMAPPRVASVEKREPREGRPQGFYAEASRAARALAPTDSPAVSRGERVVWEAGPDAQRRSLPVWGLVAPALEAAARGEAAIIVVPDARAAGVVEQALAELGLARWSSQGGDYAVVHGERGPSARYGAYLAAMRGEVPLVIGTRPVALQPVPRLGLMVIWDDGSSTYHDPHAPYPHARTVAALRSEAEGLGLLLAGFIPSMEAQALVERGWASMAAPSREAARDHAPAIQVLTDARRTREGGAGSHWIPSAAWRALKLGLEAGPCFVLVPRVGYVLRTACASCGHWAECRECGGSLGIPVAGDPPTCGACGVVNRDWHCQGCRDSRLARVRQGVERVAEELRRMFPAVEVHLSSAATGILADGSLARGLVVASPSALPSVDEGYVHGVVVLADSGLGAKGTEVDAARHWFGAAALIRARGVGGGLTVVGELPDALVRSLETWTPGELARGALLERKNLGLPPETRFVLVTGDAPGLAALAPLVSDTPSAGVREIPASAGSRGFLCTRRAAPSFVEALREIQKHLSQTGGGVLRLRVDGPLEAGG